MIKDAQLLLNGRVLIDGEVLSRRGGLARAFGSRHRCALPVASVDDAPRPPEEDHELGGAVLDINLGCLTPHNRRLARPSIELVAYWSHESIDAVTGAMGEEQDSY